MKPLLSIRNLITDFVSVDGRTRAVNDLSFDLEKGEILGIVGESGCGKSVTSFSIMGLLPRHFARISGGQIVFGGRDLLAMSESERRQMRGKDIAMIFQEPMTSLNPLMTIGDQIAEGVWIHEGLSRAQARRRALEMLDLVRVPDAGRRLDDYPHSFSGGMRQRVMIAIALACRPKLLIADEPTTALDVTIQSQILELMTDLRRETGAAIMLITHDLGVVAECCDRVMVMYAGRKVEEATVDELFDHPAHPYTRGLMQARPTTGHDRLSEIPGRVPDMRNPPRGCLFAARCPKAQPICHQSAPEANLLANGHLAACHFPEARVATAREERA
ncbi:MAG: peptide ABC transporter ATP-binding protein [Acidobacteria bacterium]|nr:peptide ABC transporter ATP-binding protein [Acidobacteriota bacterium]